MGCFLRWKTKKGGAELNNKQRYENLQHGFYAGAGKYDIPQLTGSKITDFPELIGFNYAKTTKNRQNKGVHFFLDDYQFLRLWNNPTAYLDILKGFRCVLTPDFSLYADFPTAMQIYNHYRKHWLGAFWEDNGIEVIPTICWSDEKSFKWCFDGEGSPGAGRSHGYEIPHGKIRPDSILQPTFLRRSGLGDAGGCRSGTRRASDGNEKRFPLFTYAGKYGTVPRTKPDRPLLFPPARGI